MQKGFIFLLIIWNSSPFAAGNTDTNHLPLLLGCQVVIPCQHYRGDSSSFRWFYKKNEHSKTIQIFFQDKAGVKHHWDYLRPRMKVLDNGSLVIDNLKEGDKGLYWCEICFQDICGKTHSTVSGVKKEILRETSNTSYITAGSSFTHACPGEFTNFKWTFEASNTTALRDSVQGPQSHFVTSNRSVYIVNITRADAGKYTCWTIGCDGRRQKIISITLCVVTVNHSEDSSVSCAVMCDMDFNNIKSDDTSNVETDTRTVFVDPYGFLNCSTKQMFDGYSTVNSTHLNKTTGAPSEHEHLIFIYGTSAALTCLILLAILICYFRSGWLEAFPIQLCCCGLKSRVEEEASVVYSSVVIKRPAKTTDNHMICNERVYSEIKV